MEIPEIIPRRPYKDDEPEGYLEGDRDWFDNNREACVWFMENAAAIQDLIDSPKANL